MHVKTRLLLLLFVVFSAAFAFAQKQELGDEVSVQEIGPGIWLHRSVSVLGSFGRVESNGLVLVGPDESVLVDTPATVPQTARILDWANSLHRPVRNALFTHAHTDRIGGIDALLARGIQTYALPLTTKLARENGFSVPAKTLAPDAELRLGDVKLHVFYPGPGHSPDNTVVWLPNSKVLFGGCLVKAKNATTLGNTAEADVPSWSRGIRETIRRYGTAKVVVPGHGAVGGPELLEHTLYLLLQNQH